jgi:hypothetical protein
MEKLLFSCPFYIENPKKKVRLKLSSFYNNVTRLVEAVWKLYRNTAK